MNRYKYFTQYSQVLLDNSNYLCYVDVDSKFVNYVGEEILPEHNEQLVVVKHPGFWKSGGSWETRKESTAYIPSEKRKQYYAGGVNLASTKEFLSMSEYNYNNIEKDKMNNITAIWHDESHLNAYISNRGLPTKELSPDYCTPQGTDWFTYKGNPKILMLKKNHEELRT